MRVARRAPSLGLAVMIALALAEGCAPVGWQRAGTAPVETQNDLQGCWSSADAAVPEGRPLSQDPSFGLVPGPNGSHGSSALVVPLSPGPSGASAQAMQDRNRLVDRCMRGLGYTPSDG
jgi:hypothetical protein